MKCPYCGPESVDDLAINRQIGLLKVSCGILGDLLVDLYAEGDTLTMFTDDGGSECAIEEIKINYCPMCGRKVREKAK